MYPVFPGTSRAIDKDDNIERLKKKRRLWILRDFCRAEEGDEVEINNAEWLV